LFIAKTVFKTLKIYIFAKRDRVKYIFPRWPLLMRRR